MHTTNQNVLIPNNPIYTNSVFTLQPCGQLEMTTTAPPSNDVFVLILNRCISSDISNFMGLLLVTEKPTVIAISLTKSFYHTFIAGIEARTPVAAKHLMVAL